jgi:tRNA threonylcarbamoyladenosine modification (KEOPS) complex Cgi121 subunit
MEMLLYTSADRQISEAIRRVGISADTKEIAALAVAPSTETLSAARSLLEKKLGTESSDALLDTWSKYRLGTVQENFGISSKELSAILRKDEDPQNGIERLAIERSALLAVRR